MLCCYAFEVTFCKLEAHIQYYPKVDLEYPLDVAYPLVSYFKSYSDVKRTKLGHVTICASHI